MAVRWMAVITGFLVTFFVTMCLYTLFDPTSAGTPASINNTTDLMLFGLGVLATGVGGYTAGRLAMSQRELHGLLVGIVGILVSQLEAMASNTAITRAQVVALAVACLTGALGGLLSRFPPQHYNTD